MSYSIGLQNQNFGPKIEKNPQKNPKYDNDRLLFLIMWIIEKWKNYQDEIANSFQI